MRKKLGLWLVAASLVLGYGTSAEAAEIKNIQPDTGIVFELTDMAKGTPGGDSSGGDQPGVAEPGGPADEGPSEPTTGSDGSVIDAPGGAAGDERPTEEPTTEGPVVEEPTTEKPADKPTEKPDEKPTEEPETVEETKGNDSDKSGLKSDKDKDAVEMATGDAKPAGGIDSSRLLPIIVIIAGIVLVAVGVIILVIALVAAKKKDRASEAVPDNTGDVSPTGNDFTADTPPVPPAFSGNTPSYNNAFQPAQNLDTTEAPVSGAFGGAGAYGAAAGMGIAAGAGTAAGMGAAVGAGVAAGVIGAASRVPVEGALPVKVEIYNGQVAENDFMLYMTSEIIIGSDPGCDIAFRETCVDSRNSRIFIANGSLYIEDLRSTNGTSVAGLRIQGQSVLRSGDVISIGIAEFCVKY